MTAMVRRVRLQPQKEEKTYPVLLRVKTSAMAGAGTSAAVFVSLYGTTGDALKQVRSTNTKRQTPNAKRQTPNPQTPTPTPNPQPPSPNPQPPTATLSLCVQPLLQPRMQGALPKFSPGSDDVFLIHR